MIKNSNNIKPKKWDPSQLMTVQELKDFFPEKLHPEHNCLCASEAKSISHPHL